MNEVTQLIRQRLLLCLTLTVPTLMGNGQEEISVAFSCFFSNNVSEINSTMEVCYYRPINPFKSIHPFS